MRMFVFQFLKTIIVFKYFHIVCLFFQPFNGTVNTFGFRSDHDARLLELISFEGGGVYHFIPSEKEVHSSYIISQTP